MRTREKPLFIRKWVRKSFPWIQGVLNSDKTPGFLGHWAESYMLYDFQQDPEGGHGVDYYYMKFNAILTSHSDCLDHLQPYPLLRDTACQRKTLLVAGMYQECPFCILIQENKNGKCRFMDVLFPPDELHQRLLIHDVMTFLQRCPIPLPIRHKGTLCPVTR